MENDHTTHSMQLYRSFLRTARALRKELSAALVEQGLTGSQYVVLEAIPEEGASLGFLAQHVKRDPSNITGIVDRLERSGLTVRGKDPRDRRVIKVFMTEEGKAIREKIKAVYPDAVHQRMQVLSEDEKKQLELILEKLMPTKG